MGRGLIPPLAALVLACTGGKELVSDQTAEPEMFATPSAGIDTLSEAPTPAVSTVFGEGDPHVYRLLLVNSRDAEAHVFAHAGAARVTLDTVPALDSVRVDVRLRATRVSLDAEYATGRPMSSDVLELCLESVNRWVISP